MKKRITALMLAALMVLGLTACSSDDSSTTAQSTTNNNATNESSTETTEDSTADTTDETTTEKFTVGVMQYMEHDALDQAYHGFVDALSENGYGEDKVEIKYENAQGDSNTMNSISDIFISDKVDLVLAIATPAAQTIAGKTTDIPILGTAITSYEEAKLVESDAAPGYNVSGTSDLNPVAEQIAMLKELVPEAQTVGFVYASNETNSVLQIKLAKEACDDLGLKYVEATVSNTNEVQQAVQSIVDECDAMYIPTDNVTAASMPIVAGVTEPEKMVVITGEAGMCKEGGLATMGLNYYDLGYATGLMAIDVLEGADVSTMPVQYAASSDEITINGDYADAIGFEVPEKYKDYVVYPSQEAAE